MSSLEVQAAYDGAWLATLPLASADEVEHTLATAHHIYTDRTAWLSKARRIEILERLADGMRAEAEALAVGIVAEGGKPLRDARVEVDRAINGVRIAVRAVHAQHGQEVPMDLDAASAKRSAMTYHEPRGVVVAISAFNHPLNLVVHQVVPALAAGCPVIVKPSLSTPLSCRRLVELLQASGLPDGHCQMVICGNDAAQRFVTDTRVSFLSFIGSAEVGWKLRSLLPRGAACALEHGGLAPVLVDETADWRAAIGPLLRGCFYHAGQVCVSGQRLYVHADVYDAFVDHFVAGVAELRLGDPADANVDIGPLISQREVSRVAEWVDEAVRAGARVLIGGKRLSASIYAPTVLADVPDDCTLMRREVFGPVVCVRKFGALSEAVAHANSVPEYFQAALFTSDLERALRVSRELHGMAVMVNDHSAFRVDWMPFGGHRASGLGVGGISQTMREMSIERMVVFRTTQGQAAPAPRTSTPRRGRQ